jgi:hypothetical protein
LRFFDPLAKPLQFIQFGNQLGKLVGVSRKASLIGDHLTSPSLAAGTIQQQIVDGWALAVWGNARGEDLVRLFRPHRSKEK